MSIRFQSVDFVYSPDTPFAQSALENVSFTIPEHQVTALIGQTGSGKTTIVRQIAGLAKPTHGSIDMNGTVITSESDNKALRNVRRQTGIVFQFPESQLFEESVLKDVMFGPKNYGASEDEAEAAAKNALELVNIAPDLYERAPFDLSGGQMRRVAIAGVLAMQPSVLILDEPTAGLDPKGRLDTMEMFYHLYQEQQLTVVLVTHNMNDVTEYADHVVALEHHTVLKEGTPDDIFNDEAWLSAHHLALPDTLKFTKVLAAHGFPRFEEPVERFDALADALAAKLKEGSASHGK